MTFSSDLHFFKVVLAIALKEQKFNYLASSSNPHLLKEKKTLSM